MSQCAKVLGDSDWHIVSDTCVIDNQIAVRIVPPGGQTLDLFDPLLCPRTCPNVLIMSDGSESLSKRMTTHIGKKDTFG